MADDEQYDEEFAGDAEEHEEAEDDRDEDYQPEQDRGKSKRSKRRGESDSEATEDEDEDSDDDSPRKKRSGKKRKASGPKSGSVRANKTGGVRATVSLAQLIEAGYLRAGKDVLVIDYKGSRLTGDLHEDGRIYFNGTYYDSCSSFSVNAKRTITPNRKADDGWKSVRFGGRLLEEFKTSYVTNDPMPAAAGGRARKKAADDDDEATASEEEAPRPARRPKKTKAAAEDEEDDIEAGPSGHAAHRGKSAIQVSMMDDAHSLVPCDPYRGDTQPFKMTVHPIDVNLVMDLHAHLSTNEVIGLLAGRVHRAEAAEGGAEEEGKDLPPVVRIDVLRAHPVKEVETGHTDVEMDPEDQFAVKDLIEGTGLQVVGWYHSHPTFQPNPSLIDICNQAQQQAFSHPQPYVAAIVSPYNRTTDRSLRYETGGTDVSEIRWFHVSYTGGASRSIQRTGALPVPHQKADPMSQGFVPRVLLNELITEASLIEGGEAAPTPTNPATEEMLRLVGDAGRRYQKNRSYVDLMQAWRPLGGGNNFSKFDKLQQSLSYHLASWGLKGVQLQETLQRVLTITQEGAHAPPAAAAPAGAAEAPAPAEKPEAKAEDGAGTEAAAAQ